MEINKIISPNEIISHYILSKREFSSTKKIIKYNAFIPPKNLRLSTFRIDGISEEEIWRLGDDYVGPVIARGDLGANIYLAEGLKIESTEEPHPRHAEVIGWPEERQKQMDVAKNLADNAKLMMRPP